MAPLLTVLLSAGVAATPRATHMHLAVSDLPRSVAFYRDQLELPLLYETAELAAFELGPFQLLLGPGKLLAKPTVSQGNEGIGVAFEVDNLDQQRRRLLEKGVEVGPINRPGWGRHFFAKDPDGYVVEFESVFRGEWKKNVEYVRRGNTPLTLDAFVPSARGVYPAVILVHGGGFTGGDRQAFVQPLVELLMGTGRYSVFTISYRLAPKNRYPKAVEDVQEALRFVRERAAEFKVDPTRIALVGESAGGYLVSMASTRLRPFEQVQAVVALYGAHDLPARVVTQGRIAGSVQAFFGVREPNKNSMAVLARGSPVTWVRPEAPPHLLVHGTEDEQVPFEQSTLMCQRMQKLSATCEVLAIENGRHGMRGWDMDPHKTYYKDRILEWLDTYVLATSVPSRPASQAPVANDGN